MRSEMQILEDLGYSVVRSSDSDTGYKISKMIREYDMEIYRIKGSDCFLTDDAKKEAIKRIKEGKKQLERLKKSGSKGTAILPPPYVFADTKGATIEDKILNHNPQISDRTLGVVAAGFKNVTFSEELDKNIIHAFSSVISVKSAHSSTSSRDRQIDPLGENIYGADFFIGKIDDSKKLRAISGALEVLSEDYERMCSDSARNYELFWAKIEYFEDLQNISAGPYNKTDKAPSYISGEKGVTIPHERITKGAQELKKQAVDAVYKMLVGSIKHKGEFSAEEKAIIMKAAEDLLTKGVPVPNKVKKPQSFEEVVGNAVRALHDDKDNLQFIANIVNAIENIEHQKEEMDFKCDRAQKFRRLELHTSHVYLMERDIKKSQEEALAVFKGYRLYDALAKDMALYFETGGQDKELYDKIMGQLRDVSRGTQEDALRTFGKACRDLEDLERAKMAKDKACADVYLLEKGRTGERTPLEGDRFNSAVRHLVERGLITLDEAGRIEDDSLAEELATGRKPKHNETEQENFEVQEIGNGLFITPDGFIMDEYGNNYAADENGVIYGPDGNIYGQVTQTYKPEEVVVDVNNTENNEAEDNVNGENNETDDSQKTA